MLCSSLGLVAQAAAGTALARHDSTRYKKLHSFSYGNGIQILRASLTRRAASASACNFDIL